jgi:hypothetical protein
MANINLKVKLLTSAGTSGPLYDAYYTTDGSTYTLAVNGSNITLASVGSEVAITVPDNSTNIKLVSLSAACNSYSTTAPVVTTTTTTTMSTVVGSAFIDTLFSSPSGVAEIGARLYQSTSGTTGFNTYVTISSDNTQRHIASNQTLATDSYLVGGYAVSVGGGFIRFNRFGVNISKLKTDYPAINVFTFDLYVARLNNSFNGNFTVRNSIKFSDIINTANNNGVDFTSAQSEGAFTDTPTRVCNFAGTYVRIGYFTYTKSANTFDYTDLQGTGCTIPPNSDVTITALNGLDPNSFTVYLDGNADTGWKSGTRSYPAGTVVKIIYNGNVCGATRNGSGYPSDTSITLNGGVAQSFSLNNYNAWTNTGNFPCQGNVAYIQQVNPCGIYQEIKRYPNTTCDCECNQTCNGSSYGNNECRGQDLVQYEYWNCSGNPTGSYQVVQSCSCSCDFSQCGQTYYTTPYCGQPGRVGTNPSSQYRDQYYVCGNTYITTETISNCSCSCDQTCLGEYWGDPYCDGTGIQKRNKKYTCNGANTGEVEILSTCSEACGAFVAPIWSPFTAPYCVGCNQFQDEVQTNTCCTDPPSGDERTVPLGASTDCGSWYWVYYCVNYGVAPYERRRYEQSTCTAATRNDELVAYDSPDCGYLPPPVCRTYQIVGYNADEYVDGTYTNCGGFPDSFSFYGGPGTVGTVCAQPSSVYITSGNGQATEIGVC